MNIMQLLQQAFQGATAPGNVFTTDQMGVTVPPSAGQLVPQVAPPSTAIANLGQGFQMGAGGAPQFTGQAPPAPAPQLQLPAPDTVGRTLGVTGAMTPTVAEGIAAGATPSADALGATLGAEAASAAGATAGATAEAAPAAAGMFSKIGGALKSPLGKLGVMGAGLMGANYVEDRLYGPDQEGVDAARQAYLSDPMDQGKYWNYATMVGKHGDKSVPGAEEILTRTVGQAGVAADLIGRAGQGVANFFTKPQNAKETGAPVAAPNDPVRAWAAAFGHGAPGGTQPAPASAVSIGNKAPIDSSDPSVSATTPGVKPTTDPNAGFSDSMAFVRGNEGGFTAVDGASGAPAIYGINEKWHPKEYAEAKRITDTQGADAGQQYADGFYKTEYWDKNKVGSLPPASQAIVMDGLVNHTSGFASKLVKAAQDGATPKELVAMRQGEYDRLVAANPGKYQQSAESWKNRLGKFDVSGKEKPLVAASAQAGGTGITPDGTSTDNLWQWWDKAMPKPPTDDEKQRLKTLGLLSGMAQGLGGADWSKGVGPSLAKIGSGMLQGVVGGEEAGIKQTADYTTDMGKYAKERTGDILKFKELQVMDNYRSALAMQALAKVDQPQLDIQHNPMDFYTAMAKDVISRGQGAAVLGDKGYSQLLQTIASRVNTMGGSDTEKGLETQRQLSGALALQLMNNPSSVQAAAPFSAYSRLVVPFMTGAEQKVQ